MEPFARLPSEIIVAIMQSVWDLPTLGYLLKASPHCLDVFNHNHVRIMDVVISGLPKDLTNILTVLMNAERNIECQQFESPEALENSLISYLRNFDHSQPPLYNIDVSTEVARDIVYKSCTIQQITQSFFETYLKRMSTIELMHMAEDTPCHASHPIPYEAIPGRKYRPVQLKTPSWIEEQRVIRALWRTQVYFDLQDIMVYKPGSAKELWGMLHLQRPSDMWGRSNEKFYRRGGIEMDSVYDHLHDLNSLCGRSGGHDITILALPDAPRKKYRPSQPRPRQDQAADAWMQSEKCLDICSPGYNYFVTAGQHHSTSFIRGLSFEPFQWLGFGIWDREKLATWEMMWLPAIVAKAPLSKTPWHSVREEVTYTWRSVYHCPSVSNMIATSM